MPLSYFDFIFDVRKNQLENLNKSIKRFRFRDNKENQSKNYAVYFAFFFDFTFTSSVFRFVASGIGSSGSSSFIDLTLNPSMYG